jgi:hypothetical protein
MMFFCYFLISSVTPKHALYLLLIVVTNHGPLTGPDIFRITRIGFTYTSTQFRSLLSLLSLTFFGLNTDISPVLICRLTPSGCTWKTPTNVELIFPSVKSSITSRPSNQHLRYLSPSTSNDTVLDNLHWNMQCVRNNWKRLTHQTVGM